MACDHLLQFYHWATSGQSEPSPAGSTGEDLGRIVLYSIFFKSGMCKRCSCHTIRWTKPGSQCRQAVFAGVEDVGDLGMARELTGRSWWAAGPLVALEGGTRAGKFRENVRQAVALPWELPQSDHCLGQ